MKLSNCGNDKDWPTTRIKPRVYNILSLLPKASNTSATKYIWRKPRIHPSPEHVEHHCTTPKTPNTTASPDRVNDPNTERIRHPVTFSLQHICHFVSQRIQVDRVFIVRFKNNRTLHHCMAQNKMSLNEENLKMPSHASVKVLCMCEDQCEKVLCACRRGKSYVHNNTKELVY